MGPVALVLRNQQFAAAVDQALDAIAIVDMPGHHDVVTVAEADQAPVEHPVHRARQGQPVLHAVRPISLHRPNMRRLDFGPAAAIDELQARDAASLAIGLQDQPPENAVANQARGQSVDTQPLDLERRLRALVDFRSRIVDCVDPRQYGIVFDPAKPEYASEILRRQRPHRRLCTPGIAP